MEETNKRVTSNEASKVLNQKLYTSQLPRLTWKTFEVVAIIYAVFLVHSSTMLETWFIFVNFYKEICENFVCLHIYFSIKINKTLGNNEIGISLTLNSIYEYYKMSLPKYAHYWKVFKSIIWFLLPILKK